MKTLRPAGVRGSLTPSLASTKNIFHHLLRQSFETIFQEINMNLRAKLPNLFSIYTLQSEAGDDASLGRGALRPYRRSDCVKAVKHRFSPFPSLYLLPSSFIMHPSISHRLVSPPPLPSPLPASSVVDVLSYLLLSVAPPSLLCGNATLFAAEKQ